MYTSELVMVNYCNLHIAVTDVPLCLWNTGAPLAGNIGFICPLSRSASTKQSSWLHNLWATNCVVNQTGYLGPWLYASRHQTSLWRRQHIYSVQFLQTAQSLLPPSIAIVRSFVNTALLMPQITPHNPQLQVTHSDYGVHACHRRVAMRTLGCIKKIKVVRLSCLGCQFVSLVDTLLLWK